MQRYASYKELSDVVNWGVYEAPFSIEEGRKLFGDVTVNGRPCKQKRRDG